MLPLFPLGTVLFPGLVLPLHVFEPRYRDLVRDLLAGPADEQRFGVVAIREGHEVGADAARALHDVGCAARVQQVQAHADGTYDVLTVGAERFRLRGVSRERSYLQGDVEWLPDGPGDAVEASVVARAVAASYARHLLELGRATGEDLELPDLPGDPTVLGHLVAATMSLDLSDRQALLAEPDGLARLRAELRLLRRETTLLQRLRAVPSPRLLQVPLSAN